MQKIPFGVDPKGIVCEFFKAGTCTKGAKCKFSHDLNVARKGAKIDLFTDTREQERAEKEADKMEDWDTDKLAEVVNKKLGKNKPTETDIVRSVRKSSHFSSTNAYVQRYVNIF